jgi:hypothetical protein
MFEILKIIPLVLYLTVGIISLFMALKSFFSKKILPFQEKAAGIVWDEIESSMKNVMLFLLRTSGLGFLTVSILLITGPLADYFFPNIICKYLIPVVALIFTSGLFINNLSLYKMSSSDTPWKGSLYAMFIITAGIIISIFF